MRQKCVTALELEGVTAFALEVLTRIRSLSFTRAILWQSLKVCRTSGFDAEAGFSRPRKIRYSYRPNCL